MPRRKVTAGIAPFVQRPRCQCLASLARRNHLTGTLLHRSAWQWFAASAANTAASAETGVCHARRHAASAHTRLSNARRHAASAQTGAAEARATARTAHAATACAAFHHTAAPACASASETLTFERTAFAHQLTLTLFAPRPRFGRKCALDLLAMARA
jgi:hypothetical protein